MRTSETELSAELVQTDVYLSVTSFTHSLIKVYIWTEISPFTSEYKTNSPNKKLVEMRKIDKWETLNHKSPNHVDG